MRTTSRLLRSAALHVCARQRRAPPRRAVDRPRGRRDRLQSALARIAQPLAQIGRVDSRHRAFSGDFAFSDSLARRPGNCRDAADAARHAVVHLVQRDRRSDGHSHRPEGSRAHIPLQLVGSLALPDLAGDFSVPRHGMVTASGGAWNASIVAEYFHFQGRIVSPRAGQHHQPRQRFRPIRCLAGVDVDHGDRGSADQSFALATATIGWRLRGSSSKRSACQPLCLTVFQVSPFCRSFPGPRELAFAPDVLRKPFFVFFHDGALLFRFGDAVAEALVDHHFYGHSAVFESLTKFVRVGGMGTRRSFSPCWMSVGVLAFAM